MTKDSAPETSTAPGRGYLFLGTLVAAYIGVYLCRKNMSVAVPILQRSWGLNKEQVGTINSVSTIAYAFGKVFFGPITDRLGGRTALLGAMCLVAVFGALGAFAPGLSILVVLYSGNRLFGSACWGATEISVSYHACCGPRVLPTRMSERISARLSSVSCRRAS